MRKWGKDIKTTKDEISSSKWVSYFEKLFYSNGGTSNHSSIYPAFNELDFAIKREEVSTAIRSLKKNKSPGLDNILNEFLIAGKDIVLDPLCNMFNTVFGLSTYPDLWSLNNHLDEYRQLWDINVNIAKSKTMIFNSSGIVLQNHTFLYRKKELELVQSFTYLGITISSSASFKKACQTLGDKACKPMYPLVDAIFKFNLTVSRALDLFEKLVQPTLLYGSEIWASFSSHQLNFISKNQDALLRYSLESPVDRPKLKFCKQILGLKRNSSSLAVYGELGIIPTALFAIIRTIKFWHRVSHLNDTLLVKKTFTESKSIPSSISNWFSSVKCALEAIGFLPF